MTLTNNTFNIHIGDNQLILPTLPDNSVDSIVTDPPYELGFMGKTWDATGIAYNVEMWRECLRVLKPGGHLLAFSGSRTYHRMAVAIEDAGFQIRDQIMWVYGSGFPKSLNISKAIDKAAGAEREVVSSYKATGTARNSKHIGAKTHAALGEYEKNVDSIFVTAPATAEAEVWDGWGTALKPAHEPIVLARKPLDGTVANNVLTHGVGGINIDGCRVGDELMVNPSGSTNPRIAMGNGWRDDAQPTVATGRFPANFIHDGSNEVLELFPDVKGQFGMKKTAGDFRFIDGDLDTVQKFQTGSIDNGSAARFFYCAKANKKDRNEGLDHMPLQQPVGGADKWTEQDRRKGEGVTRQPSANFHPTVKPTDLMRYLCRLITPPNGVVLDPFTGSGSTGKAAVLEGFNFIGIEQSPEYAAIAQARIEHVATDE
jgi:DNA modification methylase